MTRLFSILTALLVLTVVPAHAEESRLTGVVELFTSQGCSSCPPADRILTDYVKRDDVLALSWHVDYWNYLGWQDTFSHADFTLRQKRYAAAMGARNIYTPQAVVNGSGHAVGSRKGDIDALLTGRGASRLTVPISASRAADGLRVTAETAGGDATLWIVYYQPEATVAIERGENEGRTIAYHNVVRAVEMAGMMKDGVLDVTLPLDAMRAKGAGEGASACALLLQISQSSQDGETLALGPIIGAARVGGL